jgi:hypothetical protein
MVFIPKIKCPPPQLDMALMIKTQPSNSAVQDILTHLPTLMEWDGTVEIVKHEVRNCRVHLDMTPKVFMYNLMVTVFYDKTMADKKGRSVEDDCNTTPHGFNIDVTEDIVVDVMWCGPDNVRLIYVARERDAWQTPSPFNEHHFSEYSNAKQ